VKLFIELRERVGAEVGLVWRGETTEGRAEGGILLEEDKIGKQRKKLLPRQNMHAPQEFLTGS
jgi:hypothetical protein